MGIMLGNLNVNEIEKRLGFEFPKEIQEFMNQSNQSEATRICNGKWHCFDIPFNILCGDMNTAQKIFDSVKARSKEVKQTLEFSIQG